MESRKNKENKTKMRQNKGMIGEKDIQTGDEKKKGEERQGRDKIQESRKGQK